MPEALSRGLCTSVEELLLTFSRPVQTFVEDLLLTFSRPVCLRPGVLPLIRLSGAWSLRNCYGLSFKTCTVIQAGPRQVAFLRLPHTKFVLHVIYYISIYTATKVVLPSERSFDALSGTSGTAARSSGHTCGYERPVTDSGDLLQSPELHPCAASGDHASAYSCCYYYH